jgi:hypothetical protein
LTAQRSAAIASTMSDTLPDISTLSFEDALRALEEVVRQLESADTPLSHRLRSTNAARRCGGIARHGSTRRRRGSRKSSPGPMVWPRARVPLTKRTADRGGW